MRRRKMRSLLGAKKTGPKPGVRNVYDGTKIARGSSSGTAAAIGARIVTAGLGTDTAGPNASDQNAGPWPFRP